MDQEIEAVQDMKIRHLTHMAKILKIIKLPKFSFFFIKLYTTFLDIRVILTINIFR